MDAITRVARPRTRSGSSQGGSVECDQRFTERVALFAVSMARERAADLLELLTPDRRDRALEYAREVGSLDSASRQGRLAREFGHRPDAAERLRALASEVSPSLWPLLHARLPRYHQSLFPELAQVQVRGEPPAVHVRLVARLVREATC